MAENRLGSILSPILSSILSALLRSILTLWSTYFSSGSMDLKFGIYLGAFGVADYKSALEIQNGGSNMTEKIQKFNWLWWYLVLGDFWSRWLRVWAENSEIRNGGFNMADQNVKSYLIEIIFGTREFLTTLITNLSWKIRNSKWRIQYGGQKYEKLLNWNDIWYSGIFGIADYESELKIRNLKWRIQYGGQKCKKLLDWGYVWYSGIFGIADYESDLQIQKYRMKNLIWRTKVQEVTSLG